MPPTSPTTASTTSLWGKSTGLCHIQADHPKAQAESFPENGSQTLCESLEWILKMKQLPYEFHNVNVAKGEGRTPEYLERYPKGGVPVIQDGKLVLGESHAIMTYLADKHEWTDLYPKALAQRAKINEYLHWHHQTVRKTTTQIFRPYLYKLVGKASDDDLELVANRHQTLESFLPVLEQGLDPARFLIGTKSPTIADISCYCELDQMKVMGLYDYADFPAIQCWMEEMEKLPYHDELHVELKGVLAKLIAKRNASAN